ncbi:RNA-binding protein [Dysgonomonas sp. 216]|uniref:RNA recognition motif domain-containing protein n=1 Tax=Dysgonomonas sp. 216 TaxID=2302934 RepID=UPI0013D7D7B8|nr:RNA-binding protein [Dysgonomonas sp. 216]NDW18754.1 RNA-binding protein [Dysgonomonas sp. 216]
MNIYVGNLHYEVKESDLKQLMEEFGTVSSVKLISDKDSGRSKGFGFVEMENSEEANKAISELNGKTIQGRPLSIKEATPRSY